MILPIISSQDVEAVKAMSKAEREDLKLKINGCDPHHIFKAAGESRDPDKRKIVCPVCGNGEGQDGTPVEVTLKNGTWLYNCFKCDDFAGDLLKIIADSDKLNLRDFGDMCKALAVGANLIGYPLPDPAQKKNNSKTRNVSDFDKPTVKRKEDYDQIPLIKADITEAQTHLEELPESQRRGITLETYRHFHCGFIQKWIHPKFRVKAYEGKIPAPSRRFIIPAGEHYNACALPADRPGIAPKYHKMHAGKMELFNQIALSESLICLVEGEFDCMSIWQAFSGNIAVVAVLGIKNWKVTLRPLLETCAGKKFLILFDGTDKSNAGREGAERLKAELLKKNFPAACRFFDDFLTEEEKKSFGDSSIDPNQILQNYGDEFLKTLTEKIIADVQSEFETASAVVADVEDLSLTGEQCAFLFSGNLSDRDNGDRIAYLFGDRFKFVTNHNEWITFSAGVWKTSAETNSAIYPFARELQKRLIANAQDAEEKKFAKPFDSAKKMNAAIQLLRGNPDIRITSKDLDTHKNLLNVQNGVIDLETSKLMNAAPELLLTQQANAIYRPDYHDPTVEKFLRDIMPNEENRAALIRWLGYALTGENSEQCALFTSGDGSNGKSTLFELQLNMLGDYATNLPVKAIVESRDSDANSTTTQLNVLAGARFALVDEFKPYHRLDVQQFKSLTGDRFLKIRRLHKEYETIELLAKLFLNGNELPRLDNTHSYALRRRIRALSFTQIFSEERGNLDKDLSKKLATPEALSGMLTICVEAAQMWYREGLLESSAMKDTKADYLNENDFIEEFISERCEFSKGASIRKKDFEERLKQEYPAETMPSRIRPRDLTKIITTKLENRGVIYEKDTHSKIYEFKGVGWAETPKQQSFADDFSGEPVDPSDTPF